MCSQLAKSANTFPQVSQGGSTSKPQWHAPPHNHPCLVPRHEKRCQAHALPACVRCAGICSSTTLMQVSQPTLVQACSPVGAECTRATAPSSASAPSSLAGECKADVDGVSSIQYCDVPPQVCLLAVIQCARSPRSDPQCTSTSCDRCKSCNLLLGCQINATLECSTNLEGQESGRGTCNALGQCVEVRHMGSRCQSRRCTLSCRNRVRARQLMRFAIYQRVMMNRAGSAS